MSLATTANCQFNSPAFCGCDTTSPKAVVASIKASYRGCWLVNSSLGVGFQYNQSSNDQSMYLRPGLGLSISAGYYIGRLWGWQLASGYQHLGIDQRYTTLFAPVLMGINPSDIVMPLPRTGFHSFSFLTGPFLTIPLRKHWSLDLGAKGGAYYNDAAVIGAYTQQDNRLLFRISPNYQRVNFGLQLSMQAFYQLSPKVRLGGYLSGFYTRVGYTVDGRDGLFYQFLRKLGGYSAGLTVSVRLCPHKSVPLPAVAPGCYPPVLDVAQKTRYDVDESGRPVVSWHSGAPVYVEGEEYLFRLYAVGQSPPVQEVTTRQSSFTWPSKLALPDTTGQFYYTVYATRRDQWGQRCISPAATGTLEFYKRIASKILPLAPEIMLVELYQLKPHTTLVELKIGKVAGRRRRSKPIKATQPPVSQKVSLDERIVYKGITKQSDITWPSGVPLPTEPSLYRYVVRKGSDDSGPILLQHTLLIEPGSPPSIRSLNEPETQQWLARKQPIMPPATKGKLKEKKSTLNKEQGLE